MSEFKLTTVEEFEAATARLLETGAKVGADSWQMRVKNQTPHCKFGEQGVCCRICSMGPCRITPKAPRGICGCDVHGIPPGARLMIRPTVSGCISHSLISSAIRPTACTPLLEQSLTRIAVCMDGSTPLLMCSIPASLSTTI